MAWYNAGTVAVANNSTNVTGTGTAWADNVDAGQSFIGPDGLPYEIASVVSATSIILATPYRSTSASGQSYRIMPVQGYLRDLATQAAALVLSFASVRDGIGQGIFPSGSVGTPGLRFSGDEDTGFARLGPNVLAGVVGGAEGWRLSSVGFGIGIAPSYRLDVSGSNDVARFGSSTGSASILLADNVGTMRVGTRIGGFIVDIGGAERLRVQTNGFIGIGAASTGNIAAAPLDLTTPAGRFLFTANGAASSITTVNAPNNAYTDLHINANAVLVFTGGVNPRWVFNTSGHFLPYADNVYQIGGASNRPTVLFSVTGAINTSDEREKIWHGFSAELKVKMRRVADKIMAELGWFQFLDQMEKKGEDGARWHFGSRAQTVWGFVADEGLCAPLVGEGAEQRPDPEWTGPPPPAFLCWDIWGDRFEPIMEEQQIDTETVTIGQEPTGLLDQHGQPTMRDIAEERPVMGMVEVGQKLVEGAGNRFGLRIDQMGLLLDWAQGERDREKDGAIADLHLEVAVLSNRLALLEAA